MQESFRYDYGQTVRTVATVPPPIKPGTEVSIVGMTKLDHPREIFNVFYPAGTDVYLIEYADGTSVEVPEEYIEFA